MTLRRWVVAVLAGLVFVGALDYLYQATGEGDLTPRRTEDSERLSVPRSQGEAGRGAPVVNRLRFDGGSDTTSSYRAVSPSLPSLPAGSKVIDVEQEEGNGLREIVVKLETGLTPIELSTFYTDELVEDWIIYRDTLTEGTGWNGVFLQYGDTERRLGVFGVVKSRGIGATGGTATAVSMLLVETLP